MIEFRMNKMDKFRDEVIMENYKIALENHTKGIDLKKIANLKRLSSDYCEIVYAACIYLVLAQKESDTFIKSEYYHFAGHLFRKLGLLKKAAQAYENSSYCIFNENSTLDNKSIDLALRSSGRSKTLYLEIGELEMFERLHRVQQNIKIVKNNHKNNINIHLYIWKELSDFGTSGKKLLGNFFLATLLFTFINQYLVSNNHICINEEIVNYKPIITTLYFTLINFATMGDVNFSATDYIAQFLIITNVLIGYIFLGIGITFFTKK